MLRIQTDSTDTAKHTLKSRSYMLSLVWNSDEATSMPITTFFSPTMYFFFGIHKTGRRKVFSETRV